MLPGPGGREMAITELLVRRLGSLRGEISAVQAVPATWGRQEDITVYRAAFGHEDGYGDTYILVCSDMPLSEALALKMPVITEAAGPLDPDFGTPTVIQTVHFNSVGLFDVDAFLPKLPLTTDRRVLLSSLSTPTFLAQRAAP